jgi:hypothetical protein
MKIVKDRFGNYKLQTGGADCLGNGVDRKVGRSNTAWARTVRHVPFIHSSCVGIYTRNRARGWCPEHSSFWPICTRVCEMLVSGRLSTGICVTIQPMRSSNSNSTECNMSCKMFVSLKKLNFYLIIVTLIKCVRWKIQICICSSFFRFVPKFNIVLHNACRFPLKPYWSFLVKFKFVI